MSEENQTLPSEPNAPAVVKYQGPKVSATELRALEILADHYLDDCDCLYFATIADKSGIEPSKIRRVVRSLARKGYAQYVRGLFDDEGQVAGSGYSCTRAG